MTMKKKIFALPVAAMAVLGAQAQNTYNGHEYVDLGLPSGTLWATMNVGASSATDEGTEYNTTADAQDFGWGTAWVLPTEEQWTELYDNCTVTMTATGFQFKSKNNSKTITFPAYATSSNYYTMRRILLSSGKQILYNTDGLSIKENNYTFYIRPVVKKYTISSIPDTWTVKAGATASEAQTVTVTNGTTASIIPGQVVVVTPANIPAGKKIKSIKVLPVE